MKSDGFRGKYATGLVTEDNYFRLPLILKDLLGVDHFVVAHDPRPSSEPLYQALLSGARMTGVTIDAAGMMPTPMLAKWAHDHSCLGLMITASHNPVTDNGIKFIGFALDEQMRSKIPWLMQQSFPSMVKIPIQAVDTKIKSYYLGLLQSQPKVNYHCLVDTAQGAWYKHIDALETVGFKVDMYDKGFKSSLINTTGCVAIKDQSYPKGYDYIIVFDGDGDRLQLVKDQKIINGDDILLHLSKGEREVVGTVLSNSALDTALYEKGIMLHRANVGDQLVKQRLEQKNARYGAEPCGHILDMQWMGYSDPVYMVSHALSKGDISPLTKVYQYQFNLPTGVDMSELYKKFSHPAIRLIVRESNTEPVIRIMLEGDQSLVELLINAYALNSSSI